MDAPGNSAAATAGLTIDELAHRVGMTVRNLREWRTLGLLPAAEMRGRVGYYDEAVVERVGVVRKLHAEGFTLELIRQMLEAAGDSADEVLQLAEQLRAPFHEQSSPTISVAEWNRQWHTSDPAHLDRAIELGLLRRRSEKVLEFSSARLAKVGDTLRELGMSVDAMLAATAAIREHADGLAAIFEQVWRDEVWQPLLAGAMADVTFEDLQATVAKLQPAAINAVIGLFVVAMDQRIAESITHEITQEIEQLRAVQPAERSDGP